MDGMRREGCWEGKASVDAVTDANGGHDCDVTSVCTGYMGPVWVGHPVMGSGQGHGARGRDGRNERGDVGRWPFMDRWMA